MSRKIIPLFQTPEKTKKASPKSEHPSGEAGSFKSSSPPPDERGPDGVSNKSGRAPTRDPDQAFESLTSVCDRQLIGWAKGLCWQTKARSVMCLLQPINQEARQAFGRLFDFEFDDYLSQQDCCLLIKKFVPLGLIALLVDNPRISLLALVDHQTGQELIDQIMSTRQFDLESLLRCLSLLSKSC